MKTKYFCKDLKNPSFYARRRAKGRNEFYYFEFGNQVWKKSAFVLLNWKYRVNFVSIAPEELVLMGVPLLD